MKISAVGSGRWGKILLSKFQALAGLHLVYGHQNREELEQEFGLTFTENLDVLFEQSDAVVLATPPATHFELTKRALLAGKDVFVEKPITLDPQQARELAEIADEKERILMVGHVLCYSTAYRKLKSLPGKPVSASAAFLKRDTPEKLVNAYWNFGIHMVALAAALGVTLEQLTLEVSDTADHNQRTFELTTSTDAGDQHRLAWDFLAPENKEDMLLTECAYFLDCVRQRQKPCTDGWHGVEVMEMMHQISPDWRKEK